MRVVIHGVGVIFQQIFDDKVFIETKLPELGIEVVGFADSNPAAWGKKLVCHGKSFEVTGIQEFLPDRFDRVFVSSTDFFGEIKQDWVQKGCREDSISSLLSLYCDICFPKLEGKQGVEVGGPSEVFSNIYCTCCACDGVNYSASTVWWEGKTTDYSYKGRRLGRLYITDATDMSMIPDQAYDFLLSSNNLEHIANPLKALKEFSRVLKPGGTILLLVPMKTKTFDHNREYTTFEHLLNDFIANVEEDDLSHLSEIIEKHDYSMDPACGGKERFILRARKNIENRCLHHHVFEENSLREALKFAGFETVNFGRILENYFIVGKNRGI